MIYKKSINILIFNFKKNPISKQSFSYLLCVLYIMLFKYTSQENVQKVHEKKSELESMWRLFVHDDDDDYEQPEEQKLKKNVICSQKKSKIQTPRMRKARVAIFSLFCILFEIHFLTLAYFFLFSM